MYKTTVILHTLEQAKDFVQICGEQPFSIDLCAGNTVVHAKSIIGVLSMELSTPMELRVESGEQNAVSDFAKRIVSFTV